MRVGGCGPIESQWPPAPKQLNQMHTTLSQVLDYQGFRQKFKKVGSLIAVSCKRTLPHVHSSFTSLMSV